MPGRQGRVDTVFTARSTQWGVAISETLSKYALESAQDSIVRILRILELRKLQVPRQKEKFLAYLKRNAKEEPETVHGIVWEAILDTDRRLHNRLPTDLPKHLISAADLCEKYGNIQIYHIHRLDQETSGILLFAKTSQAASALSSQFREHQVSNRTLPWLLFPLNTINTVRFARYM